MVKKFVVCGAFAAIAIAIACADKPGNPLSPSASGALTTSAAADGSTLKATAPTPLSPTGGIRLLEDFRPSLVLRNSTGEFAGIGFAYRFQVFQAGNVLLDSGPIGQGDGSTSWRLPSELESDKEYVWRARAELEAGVGPWSTNATFLSPERKDGYIVPGELYDPLINGKTVGNIEGSVTFIPGVGVRLNDFRSHIRYELPQTMIAGEFSILVTGMPTNTEGNKVKVMAMSEGRSDIITNDRRMTVEKRGDPAGVIAWRFISHFSRIETVGVERVKRNFNADLSYLFKATWGGRFNLEIFEGGVDGRSMYNFGKPYDGLYDPDPHVAYIGAPVGRSGVEAASVPGMIVRQVWISTQPRPAFASK